ncbi:hypothetical protein C0Q70_18089 [Pomacea canaliculata]|uniref:Uncharacterized protein n=1 Tax=Pomacea canaliculata TaxID=400727 RepID=A0A2T7NM94_POMCA|nr:hypothetical protein C0Q70_18089 [Pomacea canaliculata]
MSVDLTPLRHYPRCSSASKPCRIKVDMHRISATTETIAAELCSCPASKPCSTDWEGDASRVITRELATTNSDTDMTLSMMFCNEVQPPTLCTDNETALEVTGLSTLPQEVDVFRCACADSRPLVIDEMYVDSAHFRHMKYVCPNFKRRCNIRRTNRDECTLFSDDGNRIHYPCKCPSRTSCEPDFSIPYETTPVHRCVWQ